ncbi:MAG TPA: formimidoylglutamate deiminase [Myxococcales bacterium]|nr:formimidoylglutamate deiminase [Myxococcales bacterium]HIN84923.1 formimidoylglutamate deiminase [Myxococcales bacterium]
MRYLLPDCLYTPHGFSAGLGVVVNDSGHIVAISENAPEGAKTLRLNGCALMPGFINSHSHVFQRMLRGQCERASTNESFWSWRQKMYELVDILTPAQMEIIAAHTFGEMLQSGYTTVKEFHYLHHPPGGGNYKNPHEMALRIQAAATAAGISLHLIRVAYLNVSESSQKRFADKNIQDALAQTSALQLELSVPVGIAPHSIRAVLPEGIAACAQWARDNSAECHAHVAEQPREIEWSQKEYGVSPMQLLAQHGVLDSNFTAVHATHLDPGEIEAAGSAGITACICPTTEANLGDGVPATQELLNAGTQLAIGTDSQSEIDPFQELRLLEYNERNRLGQRQILDPVDLINATTEAMTVGSEARFLSINLTHTSLLGIAHEQLASALVMAGRPECIQSVWMGSGWVENAQSSSPFVALCRELT